MTVPAPELHMPYPGLRSFTRHEADIFFGREEQTDELLRRLARHRLIAVVGPSGCGKSSLVRAGLQASLEAGHMARAGVRWRTAWMRPGATPLSNLADAICADALADSCHSDAMARGMTEAALRRGPLGLVEIWREAEVPSGTNLLVITDQFEEVFRYSGANAQDEAMAFVSLLLATAAQCDIPIYVVLTMRTDFLGRCAVFSGLPEALNECQYLCPRLTREQRRLAIVGPARVYGGDVAPDLANHILNSMGPESEQLPVLQHLLMRMWQHSKPRQSMFDEVSARMVDRVLTIDDYEAVAGLRGALSRHADEAFASLLPEHQRLAEKVFRRLCERGKGHGDVRSPGSIAVLSAAAGVSCAEVQALVEVFRAPRYSFLMPPPPEALQADTVVDISHESLIHGWNRMSAWIESEGRAADEYRFLAESAKRWEAGEAALWRSPDLETGMAWRACEQPTAEWANRYGGNFDLAMRFLEESARLAETERELHERQALERTHARRMTVGLASALALAVLLGAAHWYLHIHEYTAHFAAFDMLNGAPVGQDSLSSGDVTHRSVSFRFTSTGRLGRVVRLEAVNARGRLTARNGVQPFVEVEERPESRHECKWEYSYDANGRVVSERAFDARGDLVWILLYQDIDSGVRRVTLLGSDGFPVPANGTRATSADLRFDEAGRLREIHYRGRTGQKLVGRDKAFGQRREYDKQGRIIELASLDADDKPMNDEVGNAFLTAAYDKRGDEVLNTALDATRAATTVVDGWNSRRRRYDAYHQLVEEAYWGAKGEPLLNKDGYHRVILRRDLQGRLVERAFFDERDEPALSKQQFHRVAYDYNENDNPIRVRYFDTGNRLSAAEFGYAEMRLTYDADGDLLREEHFDERGNPTLDNFGVSRIVQEHNTQGRMTRRAFYGINGDPIVNSAGYASRTAVYDASGHETSTTFRGENGNPTVLRDGYATLDTDFDSDGFVVAQSLKDDRGQLVVGGEGYAIQRVEHDPAGYERRVAFFDDKGAPTTVGDGYAGYRRDYDSLGHEVRRTYFDANGKAVAVLAGYAGSRSHFDAWGREVERTFLDAADHPVFAEEGSAGWHKVFNARGYEVEKVYLNIDGSPTTSSKLQYARLVSTYDERNRVVARAYLDPDRRPVRVKGCTRIEYTYDSRGHETGISYVDLDNTPAFVNGYHRIGRTFDDRGHVKDETYFDANGSITFNNHGFARVEYTYDTFGRVIGKAFFDTAGERMLLEDGSHAERRLLDRFGNVEEFQNLDKELRPTLITGGHYAERRKYARGWEIERGFYDKNGALVRTSLGHAVKRFDRDARGHLLAETYLDENGNWALQQSLGHAKIEYERDAAGRIVAQQAYDAARRPHTNGDGYWRKETTYLDGREHETRYLDVGRRPVIIRDGYAVVKNEYDAGGNTSATSYFGLAGSPARDMRGVHRYEYRYDPRGQLTELIGRNTLGRLTRFMGVARIAIENDDRGNQLSYRFYGVNGKPTVGASGFASKTQEYDARGNIIALAYFDTSGNLAAVAEGTAKITRAYDEQDNLTEERHYDAKGKPLKCAARSTQAAGVVNYAYDSRRRRIREVFLEPDGAPATVACVHGAQHRVEFTYDEQGRQTEARYFGIDNKSVLGFVPNDVASPSHVALMRCARWVRNFAPNGKESGFSCYGTKGETLASRK